MPGSLAGRDWLHADRIVAKRYDINTNRSAATAEPPIRCSPIGDYPRPFACICVPIPACAAAYKHGPAMKAHGVVRRPPRSNFMPDSRGHGPATHRLPFQRTTPVAARHMAWHDAVSGLV
jgi:hypothetical protein